MDPLSAYSLFCNIVTTVDAAVKIGKSLKELYDSSNGFERESERLRAATDHLDTIVKTLASSQVPLSSAPHLNRVVTECVDVTAKIQAILDKCRVPVQSKPRLRAVAVVKAWAKSQSSMGELQTLQADLQASSDRLRDAMAVATGTDLASIKDQLYKMGQNHSDVIASLTSINGELVNHKVFNDIMTSRIVTTLEEAQDSINHAVIMRALRPQLTNHRENEISGRYKKTFEWVLDPNPESETRRREIEKNHRDLAFVSWLEGGSGVFHFAGKPGSGKSTLLKFLANDPRVRHHLETWAASDNKQLVLSKFFFWKYGSDAQKSVRGLRRGLLYDVCMHSSAITKLLFPSFWGGSREIDISDDQIRAVFDGMRTNTEILNRFRHWTKSVDTSTDTDSSFLKLCVSSREDHAIMNVFETSRQIRLQDITHGDISRMARGTLYENKYFLGLEGESVNLVNSIINQAKGVFLWVKPLLNILKDELSSGVSSIAALRNIVKTTPSQLEDFIAKILDSIPKHHRYGAYFVISMALRMIGHHLSDDDSFPFSQQSNYQKAIKRDNWQPSLPLYGVSTVIQDLEIGDGASGAELSWSTVDTFSLPLSTAEKDYQSRSHAAHIKLRAWCKGLLEIGDIRDRDADHLDPTWDYAYSDTHVYVPDRRGLKPFMVIRFTHRSIPDFLRRVVASKVAKFGLGFKDEDIAVGIIASLASESRSRYNDTKFRLELLARYCHHMCWLLRLRSLGKRSRIFHALERMESARYDAYRRASHETIFPEARKLCLDDERSPSLYAGAQDIFFFDIDPRSEFLIGELAIYNSWKSSTSIWAAAAHAGLHEYLEWKIEKDTRLINRTGVERKLLFVALLSLSSQIQYHLTTLRVLLAAGALRHIPFTKKRFRYGITKPFGLSPKQICLTLKLEYDNDCDSEERLSAKHNITEAFFYLSNYHDIHRRLIEASLEVSTITNAWIIAVRTIMRDLMGEVISIEPHRSFSVSKAGIWDFLEVWLEYGAVPPISMGFEIVNDLRQCYRNPKVRVTLNMPVMRSEFAAHHLETQAGRKVEIVTVAEYVSFEPSPAWTRPSGELKRSEQFKASFATPVERYSLDNNDVMERYLREHVLFQPEASFATWVEWFNPANKDVLLGYIERNLTPVMRQLEAENEGAGEK
ncbi:hypothetical protein B0T17DRAFT_511741 [Bombardia bombarda]|uniref:Nephrocystin 3-like N-terminal domain-containing protein n=1 Tax=Bombardia bombarda TaxID=252184 RepID=A0AA39U635_9PEZI|nr:hypothetical protein B0T17DRAFT_511741 [Bombardia bombarda]